MIPDHVAAKIPAHFPPPSPGVERTRAKAEKQISAEKSCFTEEALKDAKAKIMQQMGRTSSRHPIGTAFTEITESGPEVQRLLGKIKAAFAAQIAPLPENR